MTTVPAHQTKADLLSAANHIEQYGWLRKEYGETRGPCCILGAIAVASTGHCNPDDMVETGTSESRRYYAALTAVGRTLGLNAWVWNDKPYRTKAEVVDKLREAAEAVFPSV
jgi:hypothetical protein